MTISASPLTIEHIPGVAKSASAWFHTSDPGVFAVGYPAGITGPAQVQAAGSRVWRRGIAQGFNGPSGASNATQYRDGVTICFDFDPTKFTDNLQSYSNQILPLIPICQNYCNAYAGNWLNWGIGLRSAQVATGGITHLMYSQSSVGGTPGATGTPINLAAIAIYTRFVVTLNAGTITIYWKEDGGAKQSFSGGRVTPTGNTPTPLLAIYAAARFGFFASILANDANGVDAWLAGNCPASPVVHYSCAEEVAPGVNSAPYDRSTNLWDGVFSGDATYPLTSAPRDSVNTGFTSPLVEVPITIAADCTAGAKNITLRRTRVGIPARVPALPDAVVYDDGALPVTVVDLDRVLAVGPDQAESTLTWPITFGVRVVCNVDGIVNLASNHASITVPATATVTGGFVDVLATASGAATATITATKTGFTNATCQIQAIAIPSTLFVGPDYSLAVHDYPRTIKLQITSIQIPGETVNLASNNVNCVVPASVVLVDGYKEFDATINGICNAIITATGVSSGLSDTCAVVFTEPSPNGLVGPEQEIDSKLLVAPDKASLMITTNQEGTVTIVCGTPGIVSFPASVVVGSTLKYEVLGDILSAGTTTVETWMGGVLLDTTSITIEAIPTQVSAGPSQQYQVYLP